MAASQTATETLLTEGSIWLKSSRMYGSPEKTSYHIHEKRRNEVWGEFRLVKSVFPSLAALLFALSNAAIRVS